MSELSDIDISFDIVEEKDRDERTFFEFNLREKMAEFKQESSFKNDYVVVGYYDGLNADKTRFLEIKTSSNPWSIGKFKRSFQRKIYALSNTNLKEAYLITCGRKISDWILKKPKIYKLKITEQDYIDALSFINNAVALLEKGDFRGGLNENGVCDSYGCYYGKNCQFK